MQWQSSVSIVKSPTVLLLALFLSLSTAMNAQGRGEFHIVPRVPLITLDSVEVLSPNGSLMISGEGHTLRLWDVSSGLALRVLAGHSSAISSIAFSPDGGQALSGDRFGTMKLWDVKSGQLIRTIKGYRGDGRRGGIHAVAFSLDGRYVVAGGSDGYQFRVTHSLKLWDVGTGALLKTFDTYMSPIHAVAFSPDSRLISSGSSDNTVELWDVATGQLRTFKGHTAAVQSVAFSRDGRQILSASADKTIRLWDVASGDVLKAFGGHAGVGQVIYSGDDRRVISCDANGRINLWDIQTGTLLKTAITDAKKCIHLVSAGNRAFVFGESSGKRTLWDEETGDNIATFETVSYLFHSLAISQDGEKLLAARFQLGGRAHELQLWDLAGGKFLRTFPGTLGVLSPDGCLVFVNAPPPDNTGSKPKSLKFLDAKTGKVVGTLDSYSDDGAALAFSPDGRLALSGAQDGRVSLWDVATAQLIRNFDKHPDTIGHLAFSTDGTRVFSASADGTYKISETVSGQTLKTFHTESIKPPPWSREMFDGVVKVSPDGNYLLVGGQFMPFGGGYHSPVLWEFYKKDDLEGSKRTLLPEMGRAVSSAFFPNSRSIMFGDADGGLWRWDLVSPRTFQTFEGYFGPVTTADGPVERRWLVGAHLGLITSLAVSPDGTRIVSAGADGAIRVWDTVMGVQLAQIQMSPSGEWAVTTPAGFFDASEHGLELVGLVRDGKMLPIERFRAQLQRHDLVRAHLSGDNAGYDEAASKLQEVLRTVESR